MFVEYIKQGLKVFTLDKKVIKKVSKDTNATKMGVIFLLLAGVASAIGGILSTWLLGDLFGIGPNYSSLITMPLVMLVGSAFAIVIIHGLARIFGGKATYSELFRVLSLTSVVFWITIIPQVGGFIAFLAMLWGIVVGIISVSNVYNLSTGKAVAVILIPLVIAGILFVVVGLTILAYFMSIAGTQGLPQGLENLPY